MNWENISDALDAELRRLQTEILELDFDAPWDQANWTLHHEHLHEAALTHAFEQRLRVGAWPSEMPKLVRWLAALRLHRAEELISVLEAWGCPAPQTVEELIEKLAVRGWPALRYDAHCDSAAPCLAGSVDDPWDSYAPPGWVQ